MTTTQTPRNTAVIRIGAFYYPVILRPEHGPQAYEHIDDSNGAPVNYSRRYNAVQFLWRRERGEMDAFVEDDEYAPLSALGDGAYDL